MELKDNENLQKATASLFLNVIVTLVFSLLFYSGWDISYTKALKVAVGFGAFFFLMATFYGDDTLNITGNWNKRVLKVKKIIGDIVAFILFVFAIMFICCLLMYGFGN